MNLPTEALLLAQWQAGNKQRNVRQGACSANVAAERISAKGFADPYTSSFGCSDFYLPAVSPALLDEGIYAI
jgi:hypothetical protein